MCGKFRSNNGREIKIMAFVQFTAEEAKEFVCEAIDEIYSHNPTWFSIKLTAAVDEIPTYSIEYDGCAKKKVYQGGDK